jgi:hypothetical protein
MIARPTAPVKSPLWPWESILLMIVFGIGVLAWPLASYGAIFMFDASIRGRVDEWERYTFAYLTWFYPALFAAAFFLYRALRRRGAGRLASALAWALPALAPGYYVWYFTFAR